MIVFGLILVLAVVVVAVAVMETGGDPVRLHLHWFTIGSDGARLYLAGVLSVVVLLLGLWALRIGIRRARQRRRESREMRARWGAQTRPPSSPPAGSESSGSSASSRSPGPPGPSGSTRLGARSGHYPPPRRQPDADDYFDSTPRD